MFGIGSLTLGIPYVLAEPRYNFVDANHLVSGTNRLWIREAIKTMWRDREQSGVTPLIKINCPFDEK